MPASRCAGPTAYATSPSRRPAPKQTGHWTPPADPTPAVRALVATSTPSAAVLDAAVAVVDAPTILAEPASAQTAAAAQKPWIVRHWSIPVIVIMLGLGVLTLRGRLPDLHAVGGAFEKADVRWLTVAVVLEAISNGMFARQQRALLRAVGVRMSLARALGVTYARSALAISMPAGSAISAGYALKEYKRSGATTEKATAVMVLSGVMSVLGLAALYVLGIFGVLVARPAAEWHEHRFLITVAAATILISLAGWLFSRHQLANRELAPISPASPSVTNAPAASKPAQQFAKIRVASRQAFDASRSLSLRDWSLVSLFAIVNWLTDLLCLGAAARAFDLPVGLIPIASIYLGVQLVRQIPLTPGGIGLIETGLLAGLVSAGGPTAAAAAVVLTYRVLSCWVLLPLGSLAWLALRVAPRTT